MFALLNHGKHEGHILLNLIFCSSVSKLRISFADVRFVHIICHKFSSWKGGKVLDALQLIWRQFWNC